MTQLLNFIVTAVGHQRPPDGPLQPTPAAHDQAVREMIC